MKIFKWETSRKKFIAILSAAIILLAVAIVIPIVATNSNKGKGHTHTYGEVSYVWNTDNTVCTATRVCSQDESHVETENGTVSSQSTKTATCTEMGETTYTATFTKKAFETQTKTLTDIPINSANHKAGEVKYVWNDDNTTCTATQYCERDAGHVISTETAIASTEETGDCSTGITTTYTATFENTVFETQTETKTISVDELEHTYGDPTVKWNEDYTDCTVTRYCSTGNHTDDTLKKTIETASDGAKTVTVYDGNGTKIAFFVYKQKTSGDGYYLYQSEIENIYIVNGVLSGNVSVKTYDEEGNVLKEGNRFIFEGYAPDSDDSDFGDFGGS